MADIAEHFKKGTFEEKYWIPEHNARRESSLFRKNKKFIRDKCGAPCWVCGEKKDLEVHHVFEWSFWNAFAKNIQERIFRDADRKIRDSMDGQLRLRPANINMEKKICEK
jgi:hypothetical protein